ncbi:hypothetical protein O9A_00011 [Bartonella koehlerae C-29]|uniref:Uncharacterized protein n=1 Tax=Bartonella koehlerae C-29 TaxID=1134510 RepID=A0A067WKT8_9HYPH|nr:hypothetical protein O9A_00011 [Bartonella koehlerae C-29]
MKNENRHTKLLAQKTPLLEKNICFSFPLKPSILKKPILSTFRALSLQALVPLEVIARMYLLII